MKIQIVRQIESDELRHVMLHTFPLPDIGDHGFYRTMISYSAFFEGIKRRNWGERYLFFVVDDDIIQPSKYEMERDSKLPTIQHKDLLAFFDYIGYDRKKKKLK